MAKSELLILTEVFHEAVHELVSIMRESEVESNRLQAASILLDLTEFLPIFPP